MNIPHWAAQKHLGNVAYGVPKAATDKMTADMAMELRPRDVTVVSLYPGWSPRRSRETTDPPASTARARGR